MQAVFVSKARSEEWSLTQVPIVQRSTPRQMGTRSATSYFVPSMVDV
ncbi:hypothetical protein HU200_005298 [Digitaria exilis]|uniref:Uncharacterized protein n=1 Tax=Digitaria exilis TaxID=1010633 RepID=A0A835FSA5_9POAL|nr:hypothetical protein HU200_005298 [Digitaria exilis]